MTDGTSVHPAASDIVEEPVDQRLERILAVLRSLADRDYGNRAPVSTRADLVDQLAAGVNRLGAELSASYTELERQVRERTAELARVNSELSRHTLYDALTELPNLALFQDRLRHASAGIPGRGGRMSVMTLDVDGLRAVNEELGQAAGDTVLREVAGRLKAALRPSDTAARTGGDEFAVLLPNAGLVAAEQIAQRLVASLRRPVLVGGREVVPSASIGVAVWEPGCTPDDLQRNAGAALAAARETGSEHYQVYRPGMHDPLPARLSLRSDLRGAIEREELRLAYLPIVELRTSRIVAVEALARWRHPRRGEVSPGVFIPMAEETGMIVPLGRWILETACRQAREWQLQYPDDIPLRLNVNVSTAELQEHGLDEFVGVVLARSGLAAEDLTLEITESRLVEQLADSVAALGPLRALGVRIAVDDFGTGFASPTYLRRLPVDAVKIDSSIVQAIDSGLEDRAFAAGIVRLIQTLRLTTIAEGIQDAAQFAHMRDVGCDLGQGSYLERPMGAETLGNLLATPGRTLRRTS